MEGLDLSTISSDQAAFDDLSTEQQDSILTREAAEKNGGSPPAKSGESTPGSNTVTEPVYAKAWTELKTKGVDIPEDYFKGNFGDKDEFTALEEMILKKNNVVDDDDDDQGGSSDPFIKALSKVPAEEREDFMDAYIQQKRFFELPAKDGLTLWYESKVDKDGNRTYSDEDITKELGGMSKIGIEREWEKVKAQGKEAQKKLFGQFEVDPEKQAASIQKENENRIIQAQKITASLKDMKEYDGIELTPEITAAAATAYEQLLKFNPKTGRPYIIGLLNDDNFLRDVVLQMTLHSSGHVKNYLSGFKEDFKEDILNMLDISSKSKSGSSGNMQTGQTHDDMD